MKVMRLDDSHQSLALVETNIDIPHPGPGELLIRVHAAGVTPTEIL